MALRDGQATLDTIGFGFGAYAKEISPVAKVSVIGKRLSMNGIILRSRN